MSWSYSSATPTPFWGEQTSISNFCERDYLVTNYVAEFVSTLTNLAYVMYAWHGIKTSRHFSDYWFRALPYWALGLVGVCSTAFHATLKLQAEWSDELSMFFATGIILHRVMSVGRSVTYSRNFACALSAFLAGIAVYHCYVGAKLAHQATFVAMVIVAGLKTSNLINTRITDETAQSQMKRVANLSSITLLLGMALWHADHLICSTLNNIRDVIGMPWGFLLELHGWWHILTAIAVYMNFVLVENLTGTIVAPNNAPSAEFYAWPIPSSISNNISASSKKRSN